MQNVIVRVVVGVAVVNVVVKPSWVVVATLGDVFGI
jgi:hypothetical protein